LRDQLPATFEPSKLIVARPVTPAFGNAGSNRAEEHIMNGSYRVDDEFSAGRGLPRIEFEEIEDFAGDTSELLSAIEAHGVLSVDYGAVDGE
jgi:hypothetical protein